MTRAFPALVSLEFGRTGIDNGPQFRAVLDALHVRRQATLAGNPLFHGLRIDVHQVCSAGIALDLDAESPGFVVIGLMKSEDRIWRDADTVERHDPKHDRAGRVAD